MIENISSIYQVEATLTANDVFAPVRVSVDVFLTNSTEPAVIVNVPNVVPPAFFNVINWTEVLLFTILTSVANPTLVADARLVSEPFSLTAAIIISSNYNLYTQLFITFLMLRHKKREQKLPS